MTDRKRSLEAQVASISQRQKRDKVGGSQYDVAGTLARCLQAQKLPDYQAAVAGAISSDQFVPVCCLYLMMQLLALRCAAKGATASSISTSLFLQPLQQPGT